MESMNSEKLNGHKGNGNENGNGKTKKLLYLRDLVGMAFRRRRVIVMAFAGLMAGSLLAILIFASDLRDRDEDPCTTGARRPGGIHRTERQPSRSQLDIGRNYVGGRAVPEPRFFGKDSPGFGTYEPRNPWSVGAIELRVLGALGLAADKQTRVYKAVLKMETKDLQVIPLNASDIIKSPIKLNRRNSPAQVLKELGDLYLAKHTTIRRPQGTSDFFQHQAQQYKTEMEASEGQLVNFTEKTGIVSADFEKQVALQKINDFDLTLQQTRASIAETEKRLGTLQAEGGTVPERVTTQIKVADKSSAHGQSEKPHC